MIKYFYSILISVSILFVACNNESNTGGTSSSEINEGESTASFFSGSVQKLEPAAYVNWVESDDNGLKVSKAIGDFTFTALYKPLEYLALSELRDSITKKAVEDKVSEYEGMQYFTFRISAKDQQKELLKVNIKSDNEYYNRIEYFSFKMQNDLKLIDGKDTLNCILFHFERVYGLAPFATFVVGFPLTKEEEKNMKKKTYNDKTFFYDDRVFGTGHIYMTIKEKNLNQIPELITN